MERKEIKLKLKQFYSNSMCDLILRGERRPKYAVIVELANKHGIPFDAWADIKSYVNDTKKDEVCSSGIE